MYKLRKESKKKLLGVYKQCINVLTRTYEKTTFDIRKKEKDVIREKMANVMNY